MKTAHGVGRDAIPVERQAAVLAELARILESPSFRGSRRCCRFLEYSVEHVLKGHSQELKERSIGTDVFQRSPSYDTNEDAVVRVTANEVRKRLAQCYQATNDHLGPAITLPPGSYAVVFQWEAVTPPPILQATISQSGSFWKSSAGIAIALLVILALTAAFVYASRRSPETAMRDPLMRDPLWSRVFSPGQKTNIVVSDAAFREVQQFLGREISLREYLAPGYPAALLGGATPDMRPVIGFLARQQTTSIGSATVGSRLLEFGRRAGGDAVIRYPRHLNAREFNTDNFILLGSHLSIPWVALFERSLNFPLVEDPADRRFYLRNRSPRAGEPGEYRESASEGETYADIAVLPNIGKTGTVLILNGIDMVAAEAAGGFAMNGLSARFADTPQTRFMEILIRVRTMGGTAQNSEVVATREIR